jgi:deoxyribose-phosphate aldolase
MKGIITKDFLRQHIDFTCVRPDVSEQEIIKFCQQAVRHRVKTIYVPPAFLTLALTQVKQSDVVIGTTAGFPYGNMPFAVKKTGIVFAAKQGAVWVDVCLNVSWLRSGKLKEVAKEIQQLNTIARQHGMGLKLIVESPYLTVNELRHVSKLVNKAGVEYIKTATGVCNRVSTQEVKIIKRCLTTTRLKVAGGISTLAQAKKFFDLGADVVGTSAGFELLAIASD